MYDFMILWLNGYLLTLAILCIEKRYILDTMAEIDKNCGKKSLFIDTVSFASVVFVMWPLILALVSVEFTRGKK